jgi:3-oxoadipate enol-lactonase
MPYFAVDGVRLCVEVSGDTEGHPLFLLHGGRNSKSTWDGVAPAFARTHRVYAVDLRGFGDSDRPGVYGFEVMRDDILGIADQVGAQRLDLIGHSMGASVAWLVAQKQPDRVRNLVVVDSPPPKAGIARIDLGPRPEGELSYDWAAMVAVVADFHDPDPAWWDRLDSVTARTLIVAGGEQSHVPQGLLRECARIVPDARFIEIPVGHNVHVDAPERFAAEVGSFLGQSV